MFGGGGSIEIYHLPLIWQGTKTLAERGAYEERRSF